MKITCPTCFHNVTKDMIRQSCHVYSNLHSILLLQEKPCITEEIVENLCLSDRVKNLENFLNEGKEYLNLANNLDEYNQRNSTIFAIMLKALDIYSRLKIQFRRAKYDQPHNNISISDQWDENINSDDEHSDNLYEDSDEVYSDEEYNDLVDSDWDTIDNTSDNEDTIDNDDLLIWFSDSVGYISHMDFISQNFSYKIMLMKIELLIMRIQNLYIALIRNRLLFALELMNYYKRLELFLSNDAEIFKLYKLKRSQQDIYKYNLLKQLIERIVEIGIRNCDTILNMIQESGCYKASGWSN